MLKNLTDMALSLDIEDIKAVEIPGEVISNLVENADENNALVRGFIANVNPDGDPESAEDRAAAARRVVAAIASDYAQSYSALLLDAYEMREHVENTEEDDVFDGVDDFELECIIVDKLDDYMLTDWGYEDRDKYVDDARHAVVDHFLDKQ